MQIFGTVRHVKKKKKKKEHDFQNFFFLCLLSRGTCSNDCEAGRHNCRHVA